MLHQSTLKIALALACLSLTHCKTAENASSADVKTTSPFFLLQDGCYALSVPGSSSGIICLDGLNEEGINGSGVRVAYGVSVSDTDWCAETTSSGFINGKFMLSFNPSTGMISMSFNGSSKSGSIEVQEKGEPVNKMSYNFVQSVDGTQMFKSKACKAAGVTH